MDDPLATLERAERRARERRLAALAEAEEIAAEAARRAAAVEAGLPARVGVRLADLRASYARLTAEAVAAIEGWPGAPSSAPEARTSAEGGVGSRPTGAVEPRLAAAAEILVRAVLGEDEGCS